MNLLSHAGKGDAYYETPNLYTPVHILKVFFFLIIIEFLWICVSTGALPGAAEQDAGDQMEAPPGTDHHPL